MVVPGSNGKENFLFENRQNIGFDQGLQTYYLDAGGNVVTAPMHGLAAYHVDDCVFTLDYWLPNEAENWEGVALRRLAQGPQRRDALRDLTGAGRRPVGPGARLEPG